MEWTVNRPAAEEIRFDIPGKITYNISNTEQIVLKYLEGHMDRRQQKTRAAIFRAFSDLLNKRNYTTVTVQDIIDEANIGRSTFYAHFDTKDALLKAMSTELFDHILNTAKDRRDPHDLFACANAPHSVFCHILHHLQENDNNILSLLTCESRGVFLDYFKSGMEELVSAQILTREGTLPREFLVNHIAGSFVEMVQWWIQGGCRQTPEELDTWFRAVTEPFV